MTPKIPDFSEQQWLFVATLRALGQPVHINLIGELVPLPPGPFLDLIRRTQQLAWLEQTAPDTYRLTGDLPAAVEDKLARINSPARLSKLLKRLKQGENDGHVTPQTMSRLFELSGQATENAIMQMDLAEQALQNGDLEQALVQAESLVAGLSKAKLHKVTRGLFVSGVLLLAKLRLRLGKRVSQVPQLLKRARDEATEMGDRRSMALADLHLGRFAYVSDRLSDALTSLVSGLDEVDELGDEDIVAQSSQFVGLYYFLQGMYKDAVKHFDQAMLLPDSQGEDLVNFFLPYSYGYCTAYLGQFHRSVGVLDYNLRRHRDVDPTVASYFGSGLGLVLLMMGKLDEAEIRLREAEDMSRRHLNHPSLLLANVGLAHFHFLKGDIKTTARIMAQSVLEAGQANYHVSNYIFPFILEHLFEFRRLDIYCMPKGYGFQEQMEKVINGPNIHLRGVAYRLRARLALEQNQDPKVIRADLEASLRYLRRSGDLIEQAKTKGQMVRLAQAAGDEKLASQLAGEAWAGLHQYKGVFFPSQVGSFPGSDRETPRESVSKGEIVDRFLDILQSLAPSTDLDELLNRVVAVATRFYRAERGGLFWFQGPETSQGPILRAACNLSAPEAAREDFRPNLALVFQAFRNNLPLISKSRGGLGQGAVLCLPFEVRGRVSGVLYHDNVYTDECFDFLDQEMLLRVARHMSAYIERIWDYCRLAEEKGRLYFGQSTQTGQYRADKLLGNSPELKQLLARADQVADSEASVLVLGETGVGKELLARRLHRLSSRSEGPFITVDLSAIPEGLVESELFGHEKGAFTGAHRQKPGRLELAHKGTLFMDEVGEVPPLVQVKLLRVLQEKTFVRVGGTRTQVSDFRLIAATNRDLNDEVAAGRFREDLFYRLNVIPLKIPPLRERGRDIVLLAKYFLHQYARKHNRPYLDLSPENQASLLNYHWPGNVRELKNVIERAVLLAVDGRLELNLSANQTSLSDPFSDTPTMEELQRRYIKFVLEKTGGRKGGAKGAAAILGMKRSTLYSRMTKLGL
jgi:transcriptional regulator with GAF, ATPase, and Fis domain